MRGAKRVGIALTSLMILLLPAWSTALSAAGTGPDDALVLSNAWVQLNAGQSRWYAFQYAGDGSQIQVRLEAVPAGSVTFAIWTPEKIQRWRLGVETSPVGRGSADPASGGALVWSGSFTTAGVYCIVVEHTGSQPGPSHYLLQVSGPGVSLTTATPTPASRPAPTPSAPRAVSAPTGKLAFQTTWGGTFYTINVDGTDLRRITDGVDPAWSPAPSDGTGSQQIAFTRFREPRGVWVINADGSGERRVFDWSQTRWPSWSPDGTRILFSRQKGGRTDETTRCFWGFCFTFPAHPKWRLGTVRLADGYFAEPQSALYSLAPEWSPDGSRFVYADEQGLRIQSEDGKVSYLITDDSTDTGPVWSPDGQRVAFTRQQHDHWEIYVVDADGRNLRRLTDTSRQPDGDLGNSASPAWSPIPPGGGPGGQYLAFFTDRSGKYEIWIMRADGSQQRPMFATALKGLTLDYASLGERAISWTE